MQRTLLLVLVLAACGKGNDAAGNAAGSAPFATGTPTAPAAAPATTAPATTAPPTTAPPTTAPSITAPAVSAGTQSHVDALCNRAKECNCPGADKCAPTLNALGDALPAGLISCAEKHLTDECSAYCAPTSAKECVDQYGAELKANLDRRAAQTIAGPPEIQQRGAKLCSALSACGCEADCAKNLSLVGDVMSEQTWGCLEGLAASGCPQTCDVQRQTACLGDVTALATAARNKLPSRMCAKRVACGCTDPGCEADWTKALATTKSPSDLAGMMQCGLALDCANTCSNWNDPSSAFEQRCIAPVKAAYARESAQDRSHHDTMMKIIGQISARSTDVYRDGVYQYSY
jgi:hypothetical protein